MRGSAVMTTTESSTTTKKAVEVRPSTQPRCGLVSVLVTTTPRCLSGSQRPAPPGACGVSGSVLVARQAVGAVVDVDTGWQPKLAASSAAQFRFRVVSALAEAAGGDRGRGRGKVVR